MRLLLFAVGYVAADMVYAVVDRLKQRRRRG